ncbi:uncharacterized protein LOC115534013 [Gadus morhua]|uniref:uncharacterized protein LOC115534013 n=1 Tax=Gadus morhua TaxID=8049 RepID=UPI0011B518B7|nr:uncharacterized protein LOC115534013 [Gadus morhua]
MEPVQSSFCTRTALNMGFQYLVKMVLKVFFLMPARIILYLVKLVFPVFFIMLARKIQYLVKLVFPDLQKFRFTTMNGLKLNADNELVKKLKNKGHTEVMSSDRCDFILAFCPISTRPGIDIQETMEMCQGDEPVILVVLHHTHDREKNVSPQRVDPSQPFKDKIVLSVACLFYEGKLLKCKHNSKEINKVIDHLSRPIPKC